ncbi:MAG: GNAT family N-acetyltransferase [Micromonosporaceae bacterium]
MLTAPVRTLGLAERAAVQRLLDRYPIAGAQVAERVRANGLGRWRAEGRLLGYGPRRRLEAVCWMGVNVTPIGATAPAVAAFAEEIGGQDRFATSLVGPADGVLDLWERLAPAWGPARDVRAAQPLMVTDRPAPVQPDPQVRLVRPDEVDLLYPASVAMYTEEVGVSPVADDSDRSYRDRVTELVRTKRSYARFADGEVVFKAELAIVTRHTAQVQGVWVTPAWRGRGIATAAMAAVVADALRRVAPSVSLYVNDYNAPARRVYERCGFRQVGTFATVLF